MEKGRKDWEKTGKRVSKEWGWPGERGEIRKGGVGRPWLVIWAQLPLNTGTGRQVEKKTFFLIWRGARVDWSRKKGRKKEVNKHGEDETV